jgi:hypothetical protein
MSRQIPVSRFVIFRQSRFDLWSDGVPSIRRYSGISGLTGARVLPIWSMLTIRVILSFVIFPYLYAPLSVIAAILSRRQDYRGKMPIVGMALGLVALIGWAAFRIFA